MCTTRTPIRTIRAPLIGGTQETASSFNYVTLRDYKHPDEKKLYLPVFDEGNADNLGLTSVKRAIFETERARKEPYKNDSCQIPIKNILLNRADAMTSETERACR